MDKLVKKTLDIAISISAVLVLLPVFIITFFAIRLTSSGPSLFRQQRVGKNGRQFVFYKFRTMRIDVDPFGPSPKSDSDQRLTRVGKFLREYSLDELPQLFNVLKGDMSIVGPI